MITRRGLLAMLAGVAGAAPVAAMLPRTPERSAPLCVRPFPAGLVVVASSGVPLRSRPVRFMFYDEGDLLFPEPPGRPRGVQPSHPRVYLQGAAQHDPALRARLRRSLERQVQARG